LRRLDRCDEAESLARRALAIWESKLGPEHEWTAWGLISLAETCLAQGAAIEAATLAERAAGLVQGIYGPAHALMGSTLYLQARALLASGDALTAERLLARTGEIQALGATSEDEANALRTLLERTREQLAAALILAVASDGAARALPTSSPERGG